MPAKPCRPAVPLQSQPSLRIDADYVKTHPEAHPGNFPAFPSATPGHLPGILAADFLNPSLPPRKPAGAPVSVWPRSMASSNNVVGLTYPASWGVAPLLKFSCRPALPMRGKKEPARAVRAPPGKKILLVEDDPDVREGCPERFGGIRLSGLGSLRRFGGVKHLEGQRSANSFVADRCYHAGRP